MINFQLFLFHIHTHTHTHTQSGNMEAEIMQVVLEESRESYAPEIVHECPSNTIEDMESNVTRIEQWTKHWIKDRT